MSSTSSTNPPAHDDAPALPSLYADRSFWGMAITQFLGAFNDNVFKFLILLMATPSAAAIAAGEKDRDLQSAAMIVFAAAFLIFSGLAGFLADKVSKRHVVVGSKVAEIVVMLLGLLGFYYYETVGLTGMMAILFFMGLQSAFFGPAKYGILPEMVREEDLSRANGIFLMLTFLAIIFGVAVAGELLHRLGDRVWVASLVCVAIAVLGTLTSLFVRRIPAAAPDMQFSWAAAGVPRDILRLLSSDRPLLWALIVCSLFWMVGGMVQQSINALGKTQLGLNNASTGYLQAAIGLGIAVGCIIGGNWARSTGASRVVTFGATGTVAMLVLMAWPGANHGHLLGYKGSLPVLALLGAFTGMFIVPIQVILQSRPPKDEKGRMIAAMNQCTWIGIILGAVLYDASLRVLEAWELPRATIFGVTALVMLPVALFYRPESSPEAPREV